MAFNVGPSTVVLTGSNFINGAQVLMNGAPVPTTFNSGGQLTANISPADPGNLELALQRFGGLHELLRRAHRVVDRRDRHKDEPDREQHLIEMAARIDMDVERAFEQAANELETVRLRKLASLVRHYAAQCADAWDRSFSRR